MRIYFFIKDVSLTGGTERVTANLASFFSSKGHDVVVVSYYKGKSQPTYAPSDSVQVVYLVEDRCPDEGYWGTRFMFLLKSIAAIKRFFKKNHLADNDVIISQNFFSNFLIWISGYAGRAIGCEHFKYGVYPKIVRNVRNFIYRRFKQIVTLTEKDAQCFRSYLRNNQVSTIANMVVVDREINIDLDCKAIIAVGRLAPQKGFDMLIDASKSIFAKYPDWQLNIFGEGECQEFLQNKIEENHLLQNVFLKGYSRDITAEFARNAFFVLSSRFEGFPLVLIEALGLGMPSVAFDCPEGPSILLEKGGGLLVPFVPECETAMMQGYRQNVDQLVEKITYMIEHREFRKQCIAHKDYIRKQLSPDVIYEKWSNLFKQMYVA